MIEFPCPNCDVNISAEEEYAGLAANCPTCGHELIVPSELIDNENHTEQHIHSGEQEAPGAKLTNSFIAQATAYIQKNLRFFIVGLATVVVLILVVSLGGKSDKKPEPSGVEVKPPSFQNSQPKQKTNRAGYEAYMAGYNDPEQGEVARFMIDRYTGGDRQAALLMILGAEDRKEGLSVRFYVEE